MEVSGGKRASGGGILRRALDCAAKEALDTSYDAAIVDVMLPGLDGLGLVESLRRRGGRTPVLILSARRTVDDRVRGLQAGGDDYLVKPFAFAELGLESRGGLLVAEVGPAGPAAAGGLQPGDVIEEVDRKPVKDAADLRAAGDRPALVLVTRKGASLFLTIDPPSA